MTTPSKAPAPIQPEHGVSEALALILERDLAALRYWQDFASTWDDTEGVHQMRVAARRLRSALAVFGGALPAEAARPWMDELRWIASQLGAARDLDVLIDEGLGAAGIGQDRPGAVELARLAAERRARAYAEQVRPLLAGERYQCFCAGFARWIEQRGWATPPLKRRHARRLAAPLDGVARKRLDRRLRCVLAAGARIDRADAEALHRLRIQCKKLRYAAEFFQPLCADMNPFIDRVKALQDLLGVVNDVAVTEHLLDAILGERGERQLLIEAGALLGWRRCEAHRLLQQFDRVWDQFASAGRPWRDLAGAAAAPSD